ncbi:zinc-dependent alcohol dehydrogenase family protein [Cribrihabitans neustonicus]|uniref:zinc-dependent alcohol dehydrogenase family protein n=1 Tax=Cribrihabitans neustonicus TaxID=1429085 RepID=UPI003B5B1BD6
MRAMLLEKPGKPLVLRDIPVPKPGPGQILIRVEACGVCRTDLHVADGELPRPKLPLVPGHEIVGRVAALGPGRQDFVIGQRLGVPWLGHACGSCPYCRMQRENLCDAPLFTGYTFDGGYAEYCLAHAGFAFPLSETTDAADLAPLLCAGLIGYRCLARAGPAAALGLYGFGAAAHILCQIAKWQGRRVFAFTREGDAEAQAFARRLGADWAGASTDPAPEPLDAAILLAPAGELVPKALKDVRKGGRVVCGGIHMSDIPAFPYADLWQEREVVSVANLTRADGAAFFPLAQAAGVRAETVPYPLDEANRALADLRAGSLQGAAVLLP